MSFWSEAKFDGIKAKVDAVLEEAERVLALEVEESIKKLEKMKLVLEAHANRAAGAKGTGADSSRS